MHNRLALGTVQFGLSYGVANRTGQVNLNTASEILAHAAGAGIDTLDTAIAYGQSEERLGEIGVNRWRIISKLPMVPKKCNDVSKWVQASIGDSLSRLKVDRLRGVLLHQPNQLLDCQGDAIFSALQDLKRSGITEKIGISIYDPQELDLIIPRYQFDIVQAPFNVLDQRLVTSGWLPRLKRMGAEVHVRSAFLQGLLLMEKSERPHRFSKWNSIWGNWHRWLADKQLSPLQACLRVALAPREIDRVVIGVDTLHHLLEILAAADGSAEIPPMELRCEDSDLLNPSHWNEIK